MPRASEYREAAGRFRTLRDHYDAQARAWRAPSSSVAIGPVADRVEEGRGRLATAATTASEGFATLAVECDRRALVCTAYATAVRSWQALPIVIRSVTARPPRPAPWADV